MSAPRPSEPQGYRAALEGAAVAARPDRARLRVSGRDPAATFVGVVTSRIPDPPRVGEGEASGTGRYAAVLTPKGRMVTDVRIVHGPRAVDGLLLEVPEAARTALVEHLRRYLPPRLARVEEDEGGTTALTVAGPAAGRLLTREALGLRVDAEVVEALPEDGWVWTDAGGPGVLVVRSGELWTPAYDVIADPRTAEALHGRLIAAGGESLDPAALLALRLEAGRPAWGSEMDAETIPPEAGIDVRAIDHGKGCYTGQEVIVRIRDRGHVNRHLRGLLLGDAAVPDPGTELWAEGRDRPMGTVTSAAPSPRAGGLALGWVRREVEVPGTMRLGGPEGPSIRVLPLPVGPAGDPGTAPWWQVEAGASPSR